MPIVWHPARPEVRRPRRVRRECVAQLVEQRTFKAAFSPARRHFQASNAVFPLRIRRTSPQLMRAELAQVSADSLRPAKGACIVLSEQKLKAMEKCSAASEADAEQWV